MTPEPTGIPAVDALLVWGGAATVLSGLGAVVWRVLRGARRLVGRIDDFIDDWAGTEERPGVPARPGVMVRLDRIEHELHPNGGASFRDALDLANRRLARLCPDDDPEEAR